MKAFLCAIMLLSLFAPGSFAGTTVKLHGKIQNPISDSISVRYSETWIGYEPKTISAKLAADGSFTLLFPLKERHTFITVLHGDEGTEIAPEPGDDLTVTVDAKHFDSTLQYTGRGAATANFMARHMLFSSFANKYAAKLQSFCGDEPAIFESKINEAMQKEVDFMKANGKSLPASFKQAWKAHLQYNVYDVMLNYAVYHEIKKQGSYTISNIPKEDYKPVMDVPAVFSDDLLNVSAYRLYTSAYYGEQVNAKNAMEGKNRTGNDDDEKCFVFKNMPPKTAELYGAQNIYYKLKRTAYTLLEQQLAEYKKRFPQGTYLPWLEQKMAAKKKMAPGSMATDFMINTTDSKQVKLSDLKGKVVYLDFWASWCGPCMAEMPAAKKAEEKYMGKDVVFLYVSIDADETAWKKAMDKIQTGGMHMRDGNGGWEGEVAKKYGVQSIPACFLIDKEGRFAMDDTPRPTSTAELCAAIDKALAGGGN